MLDKQDGPTTDPELVEAITNEAGRFLGAVLRLGAKWLASPDEIKALSQGKATIESK